MASTPPALLVPFVGTRIKTIRLEKGISADQIVTVAGISRSYFSKIERGQVTNIRFSFLEGISEALEVGIEELLPSAFSIPALIGSSQDSIDISLLLADAEARGVERGIRIGAKLERERIIRLLGGTLPPSS